MHIDLIIAFSAVALVSRTQAVGILFSGLISISSGIPPSDININIDTTSSSWTLVEQWCQNIPANACCAPLLNRITFTSSYTSNPQQPQVIAHNTDLASGPEPTPFFPTRMAVFGLGENAHATVWETSETGEGDDKVAGYACAGIRLFHWEKPGDRTSHAFPAGQLSGTSWSTNRNRVDPVDTNGAQVVVYPQLIAVGVQSTKFDRYVWDNKLNGNDGLNYEFFAKEGGGGDWWTAKAGKAIAIGNGQWLWPRYCRVTEDCGKGYSCIELTLGTKQMMFGTPAAIEIGRCVF
ncbi:MAG: hypothetical protein M1827_005253 [Pycnora praestabilis]|nr:MAG: hypothetical protein M1827_005253 [Pycnora praestabilis]